MASKNIKPLSPSGCTPLKRGEWGCLASLYPRASPESIASFFAKIRRCCAGLAVLSVLSVACRLAFWQSRAARYWAVLQKGCPETRVNRAFQSRVPGSPLSARVSEHMRRRCPIHAGSRGAFREGIRQCPAALFVFIANSLNFRYGVAAPCRTPCTVCSLPPCIEN